MGLKGFESYGCYTVYNLFWFEIMSFFFFSTTFSVCLETTYLAEIRKFLLKGSWNSTIRPIIIPKNEMRLVNSSKNKLNNKK